MKVCAFLLFAFIGLACARESFWAHVAHEISDAFASEEFDLDNLPDMNDLTPQQLKQLERQLLERLGAGPPMTGPNPRTKQDGPTDLKLNKKDCRCRLNTKQRIVNGQEAVKNR